MAKGNFERLKNKIKSIIVFKKNKNKKQKMSLIIFRMSISVFKVK